eukprot:CAMPEP_0194282592 /NCGR_PEP_ID=MMETSP0169-20130528/23469_1 /TAXON_ID=218684 /ORGANISM="Corethron pennatum, Strain L29A3" /LENGTH=217 /DNA_ID=CAMNT_0039027965 /DNA_START=186 /DNA_END=839 /DNA_ORIENTATION=-
MDPPLLAPHVLGRVATVAVVEEARVPDPGSVGGRPLTVAAPGWRVCRSVKRQRQPPSTVLCRPPQLDVHRVVPAHGRRARTHPPKGRGAVAGAYTCGSTFVAGAGSLVFAACACGLVFAVCVEAPVFAACVGHPFSAACVRDPFSAACVGAPFFASCSGAPFSAARIGTPVSCHFGRTAEGVRAAKIARAAIAAHFFRGRKTWGLGGRPVDWNWGCG